MFFRVHAASLTGAGLQLEPVGILLLYLYLVEPKKKENDANQRLRPRIYWNSFVIKSPAQLHWMAGVLLCSWVCSCSHSVLLSGFGEIFKRVQPQHAGTVCEFTSIIVYLWRSPRDTHRDTDTRAMWSVYRPLTSLDSGEEKTAGNLGSARKKKESPSRRDLLW